MKLRTLALLAALSVWMAVPAYAGTWTEVWTGGHLENSQRTVGWHEDAYITFANGATQDDISPRLDAVGRTTICIHGGGSGVFELYASDTAAKDSTDATLVWTFPSDGLCYWFGKHGSYYIKTATSPTADGGFDAAGD